MTFLDQHPHTRLGELVRLPVSRVHEPVHEPDELIADTSDIVLGEGTGGYPTAVIPIAAAAAQFVASLWVTVRAQRVSPALLDDLDPQDLEAVLRWLNDLPGGHADLTGAFARWDAPLWAEVTAAAARCTFGTAFDVVDDGTVRNWLIESLGEVAVVTDQLQLVGSSAPPAAWQAVRALARNLHRFDTVAIPATAGAARD